VSPVRKGVQRFGETPSRSFSNRSKRVDRTQEQSISKPSVWLRTFLDEICRQQTQKHEDFLSSFTKLFKSQDTDHDGIINDEQFHKLIQEMNIGVSREQAERFLKELDPFGFEKIVYSDLIKLLSTQQVSRAQISLASQPEWSCNEQEQQPYSLLKQQSLQSEDESCKVRTSSSLVP